MKEKILELLKQYSGHEFIELTSRGNTAIMAALQCCRRLSPKSKVLIPDQGGWLTYEEYGKKLGMEVVKLKTDKGLINVEDLKTKVDDAGCLIYHNPGGYFVEQPISEIYKICKGKCLVILDVCGCISDTNYGEYCDLSVCSFGRWKPINVGYGGFISVKEQKHFDISKEILETQNFDTTNYPKLLEKLEHVKERFNLFYEKCSKIKQELKQFNVLHRESKGINVVVAFKDDEEKEKLIKYCNENNYEYTICPRYIRVNENAVSIEVKRIN